MLTVILGVICLERFGDRRAVGVNPDGDRAVLDLLGGRESVAGVGPAAAAGTTDSEHRDARHCCGQADRTGDAGEAALLC